MKIIIQGRNRVQVSKIKVRTWEKKRWFASGSDMYRMAPDQFKRIIVTRYGHRVNDEEGLIFPEGGLIPKHCDPAFYRADKLLMEIREHKVMSNKKLKLSDLIVAAKIRPWIREIRKGGPALLVMVIVMWALIF